MPSPPSRISWWPSTCSVGVPKSRLSTLTTWVRPAPSMTSQRFVPISGAWCRRQGGHSYRPLVLPEEDRAYAPRLVGIAWLFPGQGSQSVGMGKDLAARYPTAARVFEEANDAIGIDLRSLCFDGPQDELDKTANTQPALVAASIAAFRAAEEAGGAPLPEPVVVLGHSPDEFTALVAARALRLADAVRLVRTRGELMHAADHAGAMAAVIGLDAYVIARALVGTHVVVANDNAPGQVVISGPRAELGRAADDLKKIGAKRVIPLRVSAAFHSPAMQSVAPRLRQAMDVTPFSALRYRLIANVDGRVHEHAREMPALLEKQVWSPVQWVASVKRAHGEGASAFVEFGPGAVLTGLVKRILPDVMTGNGSDESTLRQSLPLFKGVTR